MNHRLPQTPQEALDLVWPGIGNPMVTGWSVEQRLYANRLAGACRLYEAFGHIYEQVALGDMTHDQAMAQMAVAAWSEL